MNPQLEIRRLLQKELTERQSKNASYSLRAYASRLDIFPSTLSEILSGKRKVTEKMAKRILVGLNISPEKANKILATISKDRKIDPGSNLKDDDYVQLNMDHYHVIGDWYYYAILSLADTDDFKDDPKWIADRLNISSQTASAALVRLERLELLERNKSGRLSATGLQFKTSTDVASLSLRKQHYQNLELARKSLDENDLGVRDFSFVSMAVDPAKIPEVKIRIKNFRRELSEFFESGKRKEVYRLCIQLFPLSGSRRKNEDN